MDGGFDFSSAQQNKEQYSFPYFSQRNVIFPSPVVSGKMQTLVKCWYNVLKWGPAQVGPALQGETFETGRVIPEETLQRHGMVWLMLFSSAYPLPRLSLGWQGPGGLPAPTGAEMVSLESGRGTMRGTQPRWDGVSDFPICCGKTTACWFTTQFSCFYFNKAFFCL